MATVQLAFGATVPPLTQVVPAPATMLKSPLPRTTALTAARCSVSVPPFVSVRVFVVLVTP